MSGFLNVSLRSKINNFEKSIEQEMASGRKKCAIDQTSLRHFFTEMNEDYGCGMYTRELTVPKNMSFTGKIHKQSHMTFLMKGELLVVSEAGKKHIKAPYTWVTPKGAKRAFFAIKDSILTNVHFTKHLGEENLAKMEEEVIAPSFTSIGLEEPRDE